MPRIFLTLSIIATLVLGVAFVLGLVVGDPQQASEVKSVQWHSLTGLGGALFATLVHAIVFTYFMGTGRWLEETSRAYQLPVRFHDENRKLKYGLLFRMTACFFLIVLIVASGAATDTSALRPLESVLGLSGATMHLTVAAVAILLNVYVSLAEFRSIERNGEIIEEVLSEVRRIRTEKGLSV